MPKVPRIFKIWRISWQRTSRIAVTALKFADIALIYSEYPYIYRRVFVNPDMQLSTAAKVVADAAFLKGAHLWVDGFSGFTAQELAMLRELLKTAAESHIALCLDPAANPTMLDPLSIFSPTERTWVALTEMVKKNNLTLDKPLLLQKPLRFASSPPLAHIEKNLFKDEPPQIRQVRPCSDRRRKCSCRGGVCRPSDCVAGARAKLAIP